VNRDEFDRWLRANNALASPTVTETAIRRVAEGLGADLDADEVSLLLDQGAVLRRRYEDLLAALPDRLEWMRPLHSNGAEDVTFSVRNTPNLNTSTVPTGPGGYLLTFNGGQVTFMYKAVRAMTSYLTLPGEPTASMDQVAERIAQLADWVRSPFGVPFSEDWEIGTEQRAIASDMATLAELFVIAHELVHIGRGHLVGEVTEVINVVDEQFLPFATDMQREAQADFEGIAALLEVAPDLGFTPEAAYAGAEAYLSTQWLLEYAQSGFVPDQSKPGAHPPPRFRIGTMRSFVAKELHHPELVAEGSISDKMMRIVLAVGARMEQIQRVSDARLRDQWPELLQNCSEGSSGIPDHFGFRDRLRPLLMRSPRVSAELFAQVLFPDLPLKSQSDYGRLKLVLGALGEYVDEARLFDLVSDNLPSDD
jgi:hypothetical protein